MRADQVLIVMTGEDEVLPTTWGQAVHTSEYAANVNARRGNNLVGAGAKPENYFRPVLFTKSRTKKERTP